RDDVDVALPERTAIANRLGASLFISLHMNSGGAEGFETYILNTATDEQSKRLADLENKVLEGSVANQGSAGSVSLIVKDLLLAANFDESRDLACAVQGKVHQAALRFRKKNAVRNRGVKQGLFYVLLGA